MFGADKFKELFEQHKSRPILVYGDPDMDGLISLLFVCQFLQEQQLSYKYYVNDNRQHGFFLKPEMLKGYLVIAVDFDLVEEFDSLISNDVVVLSLDHHEIQDKFIEGYLGNERRGIVINNQYPFEPKEDMYLSGAGVVYETLISCYPEFKSKEREALVGITLLSDIRSIENSKARSYLKTTYQSDTTVGYFKYIVDTLVKTDFVFGYPRVDRSFIDYMLSPAVNSLLRFNLVYEAVDFIFGKGMSVSGTKECQAELIRVMKERAHILTLANSVFVVVDEDDFDDYKYFSIKDGCFVSQHSAGTREVYLPNFIGLLASGIKGTGKSVMALVTKKGVVTRASFRGRYDELPYRQKLVELGLDAQGHGCAFGILNFTPVKGIWEKIDEQIGLLDAGHVPTAKVINVKNMSFALMQSGYNLAEENCYVRDMFRTYYKYCGMGAKILKTTYQSVTLTNEEVLAGQKPDKYVRGIPTKYLMDSNGEKIPKYIEYCVDGKIIKSFGTKLEDGLILPILEKGTIQLYVREV